MLGDSLEQVFIRDEMGMGLEGQSFAMLAFG